MPSPSEIRCCSRCRRPATIVQQYSGLSLCGEHLRRDLETKAKRLVRQHRWIRSGSSIAVALSGRVASSALLLFLQRLLADRRDLTLTAFTLYAEEDPSTHLKQASLIAAALGVDWKPFQWGAFPPDPDETLGSFHAAAAALGADTVALGETLDDRAGTVLELVCRGKQQAMVGADLYHRTGDQMPVITPFCGIPFEEVDIYAGSLPVAPLPSRVPNPATLSGAIDTFLASYSAGHPSTRYALLSVSEHLASVKNSGDGLP